MLQPTDRQRSVRMKVKDYRDVDATEDAPGVFRRVVVGPDDGAPRFVMRVFDVAPGSSTPCHVHWWEHAVFVLSGTGVARFGASEESIAVGNAVYVPPDEEHCFVNTGGEVLRFICVIPSQDPPAPTQ